MKYPNGICRSILISTLFPALFFVVSCTTGALQKTSDVQGKWETRVLIKDNQNQKSQKMSMDIRSIWPSQLRLDAFGPLGIQVGTFVAQNKKFQMVLPLEKKYYEGNLRAETLTPFLKMSFDPYLLTQISFDRAPSEKNWTCVKDAESLPLLCERKSDGFKIEWKDRKGNEKRVFLTAAQHEIQIVYKTFTPKVEDQNQLFELPPPENYEKYKIL